MISNEETVEVLIEAWKLMLRRLPGAAIEHAKGVATMFAHVPLPFLNLSMPDCPLPNAEDLRGALAVARERARSCEHGSLLALCEAWAPAQWEQVALEEGFAMALNMTGMAADRLLRNLHLWDEDSFGYVGYTGEKAVTSAAAFPVCGTMYIALVATMPEAHGKGYAEAVMRHAIEQAGRAMGPARMTLHASDMGRPVYRAMGFQPGARVMLLAPADAPAGH